MKLTLLFSYAAALVPLVAGAPQRYANSSTTTNTTLSVSVIHEFPKGTWLQDLAVRPSGSILTTTLTAPTLYELSATAPTTPTLLYTFPGVSCALGIAEAAWDTYYITVGNFSFTTFSTVPGSYALYSLSYSWGAARPTIQLVTALPTFNLANGIVAVANTPYLLLADADAGTISRFDTRDNTLTLFLSDPILTHSALGIEIGVNGLHIAGGYLYFTNTNQALVARVPISFATALPTGDIEILATGSPSENFALGISAAGYAGSSVDFYGAEGANNDIIHVHVQPDGSSSSEVILGAANSTLFAGPTALVWGTGAEASSLYVSSTGGIVGYMTGNFEVGGRISRIDGIRR